MRWAPALALVLTVLPVPAVAQTAAARVALEQWQDTLHREVDTALVLGMYLRTARTLQAPDDRALLPLRAGLLAIRLGELTDQPDHFQDALERFHEVQEAHADWPWGWYGAGLAHLGVAGTESKVTGGVRELFGISAAERAISALVRSASIDPAFVGGIRRVADQAIALRGDVAGRVALQTLRALANQVAGKAPELLLARARVEREFGAPSQALGPLVEFLSIHAGNAAALLELARTRFIVGQLDGVEPWFDGLARATDSVLAAYRGDIAPLGADSMLGEFDRADAAGRVAVMRRYWASQDPDRLPATAERMRDHYLRLDYARRYYRLRGLHRTRGVDPAVLAMGAELDDRGTTYVRHGPPDDRAVGSLVGVPPNESWAYHRPDGTELLFHFTVRKGEIEYRRYTSLLDVLTRSNQFRMFANHGERTASSDTLPRTLQTYGAELSAQIAQQLMLSRWNISPLYRELLGEGKAKADSLQAAERAIGERSAAMPGSFALRYELPLAARVQVLAVGRERTGGTVQVLYSVHSGGLTGRRTLSGSYRYDLRMRVAVIDSVGALVMGLDTMRSYLSSAPLGAADHLNGRFPLAVLPGRYAIRVALESDSRGVITPRQTIEVYSREISRLALSDLALGAKSVRVGWMPSATDTAWVNPRRRFAANESMQLYFEVGGLAAGTRYQTNMAVYRVSGDSTVSDRADSVVATGGNPAISLGYVQTHPGGVVSVKRELSLQRLRSGEYVLEVTVSTSAGPSVVRRQAFVVTR